MREVAPGLSNRETAQRLFLSEATVTFVTRILAKIGTQGRVQAVVLAYRRNQTGLTTSKKHHPTGTSDAVVHSRYDITDCGRSPSPPGPRVTVGMMDVALGSASAVSAVEPVLLAVDRETSDRWFAVHHCSRKCSRSDGVGSSARSRSRSDRDPPPVVDRVGGQAQGDHRRPGAGRDDRPLQRRRHPLSAAQ
jgi:hypothetical protein